MVWHDRILISLRLSLSFPHPEINADHKQYMTNSSVFQLQQNAIQKRPRYCDSHSYPDNVIKKAITLSYYTHTTLVLSAYLHSPATSQ